MSKNYDPIKAHEYYMKHRKLKGGNKSATTRMSSPKPSRAGVEVGEERPMTDEEKRQDQIRKEYDKINAEAAEKRKQVTERIKEQRKQLLLSARQQINALREQIIHASPEQAAVLSRNLQSAIGSIQDSMESAKETLQAIASGERQQITDTARDQRAVVREKYKNPRNSREK